MWSLILEAVIGALKAVLGLGAPKTPTATDLATQAATATTRLQEEQIRNATLDQAAAVRAAADTDVLRDAAPDAVDAGVNARLAARFPDEFRD
jgi:MoxR-like ATPase